MEQDDFLNVLFAAKLQVAARDEFVVIPDSIDFDKLEKTIANACSLFNNERLNPPSNYQEYKPPLEKADLNRFAPYQIDKVKRAADNVRKIGWFLQQYEHSVDDATDKVQWLFISEYQDLADSHMLGPEFYDLLLARLQKRIAGDDFTLNGSVELLMLYFFYKCDIFKKTNNEISTDKTHTA